MMTISANLKAYFTRNFPGISGRSDLKAILNEHKAATKAIKFRELNKHMYLGNWIMVQTKPGTGGMKA
jgi:hypothetical protein